MKVIFLLIRRRFLPVAVFVVAWLKTKIFFGSALRSVGRHTAAMVLRVKRRIFGQTRQVNETREPINSHAMAVMNFD
jgi:hypothetical protein